MEYIQDIPGPFHYEGDGNAHREEKYRQTYKIAALQTQTQDTKWVLRDECSELLRKKP